MLAVAGLLPLCGCGASITGSGLLGDPGSGGGPGSPGATGNPLGVPLQFAVLNDASVERTETMSVSIPFPRGGYPNLANVVVSGHQTAWRVLQRWPDGTVRVGQAQFTDVLAPNERKIYAIARDVPALTGAFTHNPWVVQVATNFEFGAQVVDTFGVVYRALWNGLGGEVLQQTPLVEVRRQRLYHRAGAGGIGRDYLTSTFYVTEFRDVPVVLVDWVLGNDYLGADTIPPGNTDPNLRPLGMIDVRQAYFMARGYSRLHPYRPAQEAIGPVVSFGSHNAHQVMQDTYLEDGQTRRYRFLVYFEHPGALQADRDRWRNTAAKMVEQPMFPLAFQPSWEQTGAAGLVGGPIAGPADGWGMAEQEYQSWAGANHFGTWGTRGDPQNTATTGTPRNGPLSAELGHAIQSNNPHLLIKLEQMAWTQAMRPYHLYGLQVGAEQDILLWDGVPIYPGSRDLSRESLGRRALWANDPYAGYRTMTETGSARAHRWGHFDHEHWTSDLLFDYWTVSGDAWAQEELRQLGQSLKGLMRVQRYSTANLQAVRAEGWTMQGFVQTYLATGDQSLRDYAIRRTRDTVNVQRMSSHPSKALASQANYIGTRFPLDHRFYMPWQHGALFFGYLGAAFHFQEPLFQQISEDCLTCVEYAWVSNYMDPVFGLVANGIRYYVPTEFNGTPIPPNFWDGDPAIGVRWGDSPMGGANIFLTAGMHLLADWGSNSTVRSRAFTKARIMMSTVGDQQRWNRWFYCIPARLLP